MEWEMKLTKEQIQTIRYIGLGLFIFFLNLLMMNLISMALNVDNTFWNIAGFIMTCVLILFDVMVIMMGYNIFRKIQEMKKQGLDPKDLN